MGDHAWEGEKSGVLSLIIALVCFIGMPLLPMVLTWFKYFS